MMKKTMALSMTISPVDSLVLAKEVSCLDQELSEVKIVSNLIHK